MQQAGQRRRALLFGPDIADAGVTARTIAGLSLPSVMIAKEAVNRAFETALSEGLRFERQVFTRCSPRRTKPRGWRRLSRGGHRISPTTEKCYVLAEDGSIPKRDMKSTIYRVSLGKIASGKQVDRKGSTEAHDYVVKNICGERQPGWAGQPSCGVPSPSLRR
jgi:hypothetical protein